MMPSKNPSLKKEIEGLISGVTLTRRKNGDVALSIQVGKGLQMHDYGNVIVMSPGKTIESKQIQVQQSVKPEFFEN